MQISQPGQLVVTGHARDFLLHQLVTTNLATEGLAFFGVLDAGLQRGADQPSCPGGHRVTAVVQRRHRDPEPLALLAQPVLGRHTHILTMHPAGGASAQAQFAVDVAAGDAGPVGLNDEGRKLFVRIGALRIGAREPEDVMGQAGQRDPHLLAVDDVLRSVATGSGSHGSHVTACACFGQAKHRHLLAARLWRQKALLLRFAAPLQQRQAVQSHVNRHGCPQTRISRLQFLAGQPQGDIIETLAAIAFRDADAENAQLGHARQ